MILIYLDNAATTKPSDDVVAKALQYMRDDFGNAGSIYSFGMKSRHAIEEARQQVADLISAQPNQIIFTSGGTEANNLALLGMQDYLQSIGRTQIIISAGEHDSVFRTAEKMRMKGKFDIQILPINSNGCIEIDKLISVLTLKSGLVSVMYVNNEVGAVNNIKLIADECRKRGVLFHTDCVQALGTVNIDVDKIQCDMLSMSSHKIHGLKGAGALYVKNPTLLKPLITGGTQQEYGIRGGTENVAGIVAFGQACENAAKTLKTIRFRISKVKSLFLSKLTAHLNSYGYLQIFHDNAMSGCNESKILNLRFDGVDSETLILMLAAENVFISAGSACHSHESEPSRVLQAIGLSPEEARNSIRVSFSGNESDNDIECAAVHVAKCVAELLNSASNFH